MSPAANVAGVSFPGMADGAADLSFNFNLYDSAGNGQITQTAAASNTLATTQDGFARALTKAFRWMEAV